MNEHDWLEWRRGGITATDVADAANGTYGGSYGVVARKLGLVTVEQNAAMDRGHRWQERIADTASVLTGLYVICEEEWCESGDDPRWRATVDGLLFEDPHVDRDEALDAALGVVEIKTRGRSVRPNRDRWADQVQWQLLVTGKKAGLLAEAVIGDALDPDDEVCDAVYLTEIEADPWRQEFLVGVAEELWGHVTDGTLPDPDTASALDLVKEVHTVTPHDELVDLAAVADKVRRLADIKAAIKTVEDERDALEAQLRAAVGDHKGGTCPGYRVTLSKPRQVMTDELAAQYLTLHPEHAKTVVDRERAKAEAKADYEAHRAPVGARTLTITETNDG